MIANALPWGMDAAAQQLAQEVIRADAVTVASVALWDQPGCSLTVRAVGTARPLPSAPAPVGTRLRLSDAPWHRAVLERRGLVCLDQESREAMSAEELRLALIPGLRSVCLLPILLGDELVGILALGEARSRDRAPFTEERRQGWLRVLEEFVAASSHSWEAARLRRQVRALSLLVQTTRQTFHARTHQDLLACLGARLADWLGVPVRGILLGPEPGGAMTVAATWDLDESAIEAGQLLLSISRAEAHQRGPVTVTTIAGDPLDPLHAAAGGDAWTRVCLPLLQPDGLTGIVCLYVQEELYLASWELEMLRWLGEVAAAWVRAGSALQEAQSEGEWLRRVAWELSTVHPRTVVVEALAGLSSRLAAELPGRLSRLRMGVAEPEVCDAHWEQLTQAAAREVTELLAELCVATEISEELGTAPVDANVLVRRAVEIARAWVGQHGPARGVPLEFVVEPATEPAAVACSTALVGALAHAIANAVEALPRGGRITVRAHADNGYVLITVADTGPGLPDEHREVAFAPLFSTKGQPHLGLGLAVVRSVAARHGGEVTLLPRADGGTVLEFRLPAHPRPAVIAARSRGTH